MGWFWPLWLRSRKTPLADVVIILYTRPGCHLCDDVLAVLKDRQRHWGFLLKETNIDADPDLVKRFGDCVPVVTVDGKLRFRGSMAPALLDRLLVGENSRSAAQASRRG